jgi:hypothetical protein
MKQQRPTVFVFMEIDREWDKFTGGPFVAFGERMYVTLDGRGRLLLNRKAFETIGKPQRVLLYFNRNKDTIGVRPAHDRLAEAFPVRRNSVSFVVYCGTFLRHYGIRLDSTEKFNRPDLNKYGMLELNLGHTTTVSGKRRKRRNDVTAE